jgi:hypothetical protein
MLDSDSKKLGAWFCSSMFSLSGNNPPSSPDMDESISRRLRKRRQFNNKFEIGEGPSRKIN